MNKWTYNNVRPFGYFSVIIGFIAGFTACYIFWR
jgi:hypothetical protein